MIAGSSSRLDDRRILVQVLLDILERAVQKDAVLLIVFRERLIAKILRGAVFVLPPRQEIADHDERQHEEQNRKYKDYCKSNNDPLPECHRELHSAAAAQAAYTFSQYPLLSHNRDKNATMP